MEQTEARLKKLMDEAIGVTSSFVERTGNTEYKLYTECWFISTEQLDRIREEVKITSISVDGGRIMLTAKTK